MAFSATVISPMNGAERVSRSLGVYAGKVSISSYATTLVTLTGITKYFLPTGNGATGGFDHGIMSVQVDGPSSGGYLAKWDYTTGAFKCYYPTVGTTVSLAVNSNVAGGAALLFDSGGGAAALHATSAVGNITYAMVSAPGSECIANVAVGTFGFIAIGLV
jgi:hypothetical protein